MNKITLLFSAALVVGTVACKSTVEKESNASITELNKYVDSVKNVKPEYTETYWATIDQGYQARAVRAEAEIAILKQEDKAKAEETEQKYAQIKADYEAEIQKQKNSRIAERQQKLRNNLFGEGKIGDDMNFDFVTGQNIRGTYEGFVTAVEDNKEHYSREDWDEVKVLYEALDTRKNAVEKDLKTNDNLEIAKQKVKFSTMYTSGRPGSKIAENSEAKE